MQKATLAIFGAKLLHQLGCITPLGRAECINIPLGSIAPGSRNKSRLATHGETHIACQQISINRMAQSQHRLPLRFGVRPGHAGRLQNALYAHVVRKGHFRFIHPAFNRGSARWLRRTRQWDMAFTRHQAGGGVQPNPASAGQKYLAPGMQVGEINLGAAGTIE